MNETEVRKLPKKTIIIILILILFSIAGFLLITFSKEAKIKEVLNSKGYNNIENVIVYNVSKVEDEETRKKGDLYKISFTNKDSNKECIGLIFKSNRKYKEDIECK